MVHAARPAHFAEPRGRVFAAGGLAIALAIAPRPVRAEPADEGPSSSVTADPAADPAELTPPEAAEPSSDAASAARDASGPDDAEATPPSGGDDVTADADAGPPGGAEPDADSGPPEDRSGDDEPDDDDTDDAEATPQAAGSVAEPLRPLQTAAWWTMFGAFAVGTGAGVLAGLSERQEDRATRLSTLFDSSTGAQPLYADRRDEYERYLRRGEGYARAAIGVGVVAGLATIGAITLFAVDARRQRSERPSRATARRARLRPRAGGMEVRF